MSNITKGIVVRSTVAASSLIALVAVVGAGWKWL